MPGAQELIVILVVALLVFGPDRLPELARNAGRWLARFRQASQRSIGELRRASEIEELEAEVRGLSQELRDTRASLGSATQPRPASRGRTDARAPRAAPAGDRPPPTDPEAT